MTVTIHIDQLDYFEGACRDQVDLFRETFGDSVTFKSKKEIIAAAKKYAHVFSFRWAAENLLDDWDAYSAQERVLWNAYKEKGKPLWGAYETQCAELFAKLYWEQET